MAELGDTLRELRKRKGLTLRDASRQLGISHSRLSDYERGRTHSTTYSAIPGRTMLARMARAYEYPLENLLGLAGLPPVETAPVARPTEVEAMEREIVDVFHRLPPLQQVVFLNVARAFRLGLISGPEGT